MKISNLQELIMGVETPMPPVRMNARRPEGRPAAGIITVKKSSIFMVWVRTTRSCTFLQICTNQHEYITPGSTSPGMPECQE